MAVTPVRFPNAPRGYHLDNEAAFRRQVATAFSQVAQEVESFQLGEHTHAADEITSGTLADARVAESNVTQHEGALSLGTSQLVNGTLADARVAESNVTQHQAALALAASQVTSGIFSTSLIPDLAASKITSGTFADARIAESNVTQHEAALAIAETQITDSNTLARIADNETITGTWSFDNRITADSGINLDSSGNNRIVISGGRMDFYVGNVLVASLDSSGNFRALGDVTAEDTP